MKYPFFVYGTLLPGQPNYYLWGRSIVAEQAAYLPNGRLYDCGPYPMCLDTGAESERVYGRLITIRPQTYRHILARLDRLEAYDPANPADSDYLRVARTVQLADEATAVTAWVYLGNLTYTPELPLIANGRWLDHITHKQHNLHDWWQNINTIAGRHNPGHQ
jgi:gamma-glutamylcyclotransferase (GGCT)/AIG2-like uncharacterized protein YtfP